MRRWSAIVVFAALAAAMLFGPWVMVPHAPTFEQRWPK